MAELINKRVSLALIGPFPEPLGGVSIHVSRLKLMLDNHFVVYQVDESSVKKDYVLNIRSFNIFQYCNIIQKSDLVHVHSSVPLFRFVNSMAAFIFRKPLIITLHSYRKTSLINRFMNYVSLNTAAAVISVNKEIQSVLAVPSIVIPAYLPPCAVGSSPLPDELVEIVNNIKSRNRKIMCSNASRLVEFQGRDLYGFDKLAELFLDEEIRSSWVLILNVAFVAPGDSYYFSVSKFISENNLSEHVFLFNYSLDFPALLKQSDLFVRATLTDGDSISVREALDLGISVIASNCTERPQGVNLFKIDDLSSLKHSVLNVSQPIIVEQSCYFNDLMNVYNEVLE